MTTANELALAACQRHGYATRNEYQNACARAAGYLSHYERQKAKTEKARAAGFHSIHEYNKHLKYCKERGL